METGNEPMFSKSQRLVLGSCILLLVDVIWVSSSELTKVYIPNNNLLPIIKHFFSVYIPE